MKLFAEQPLALPASANYMVLESSPRLLLGLLNTNTIYLTDPV